MACILLWSSAVRVHDSQACRKMDVTRERISRILELREILLSFQTGFNLVSAAVVCAILESIPGLEPRASVHLLWSLCWCQLCCLSSAWSSRHWPPCRRLWRLCRDAQLILPVLLSFLLSQWCHRQSENWRLFCLQCRQCLRDILRRLSWSFQEICCRRWVRVDIPVGLQL